MKYVELHTRSAFSFLEGASLPEALTNIGAAMNITPTDIVNSISGETGLPGNVIGRVDIRERHSFVDVSSEHARAVIAKLNRSHVKGYKTKVKVA